MMEKVKPSRLWFLLAPALLLGGLLLSMAFGYSVASNYDPKPVFPHWNTVEIGEPGRYEVCYMFSDGPDMLPGQVVLYFTDEAGETVESTPVPYTVEGGFVVVSVVDFEEPGSYLTTYGAGIDPAAAFSVHQDLAGFRRRQYRTFIPAMAGVPAAIVALIAVPILRAVSRRKLRRRL